MAQDTSSAAILLLQAARQRAADTSELVFHHTANQAVSNFHLSGPDDIKRFKGVHIIDSGSDLMLADSVAAHLARAFDSSQRCHALSRTSNNPREQTAALITGIMITGDADWQRLLSLRHQYNQYDDALLQPRQTYEVAVEQDSEVRPALCGMVCWSGHGLVRRDQRRCLSETQSPPGEGFLHVSQIAHEMLSKAALIPKYGA